MVEAPASILAGRFRLVRVVGSGGFGTVWLATERGERRVAVKILNREHAADPELVARFEREAQLGGNVDHPNVVRVLGHGRHDGRPFMAMEWVEGQTLRRVLDRRGPLPPHEAATIARQVLAGLAEIHRRGVLLLDIKPGNIMIGGTGPTAKIVDFGAACRLGEPYLFRGDQALGTPAYMAPEQRAGETVGPETDLYAVGVVLFEMLTGRLPRDADDDLGPAVPPDLAAVVRRALASDPAARFRSAAAMARAIEQAALPLAPIEDTDQRPVVHRPAPQLRRAPSRWLEDLDAELASAMRSVERLSEGFDRVASTIGGWAGLAAAIVIVLLLLVLIQRGVVGAGP
ncbi:serine/threonine-protein kinase [Sphaerobacter thermophilus]|uniref:Serine/threonine protein kinase n=1 Tax=Sphaerobacter thermophilus (strain ATCC 49802 / DSM 20745 / KCCM 41009 / NCIMB 13125 / S 6022) TaxID=479434 RepID=D1C619_SPHTD|nr:serine/threonine-protein kinase [Sphaerobacter thermophilus]ACZ37557.1 serine/threonine protein kinase [Sphaerobacter thermophilus DSM 20745]